jgi:flagellar protein FlaJ
VKLSELFTGISTTIHSGGSLSGFFEKRAETLLVSYRLEREKFSKVAETFMDIYITVAIAAPMILLLVLMMLSLSGNDLGLNETQLTLVVITVIALANIFFLTMLHMKQPKY